MAGVTLRNIGRNIALRYAPAKGGERNVRQVPPFRGGLMLRPCPGDIVTGLISLAGFDRPSIKGWVAMVGGKAK